MHQCMCILCALGQLKLAYHAYLLYFCMNLTWIYHLCACLQPYGMTTGHGDYPSLFGPDSEDEHSSDTGSDGEDRARPSLLPLDVSVHTSLCHFSG